MAKTTCLDRLTEGDVAVISCLSENLSRLMEAGDVSLTTLHRKTGVALPTLKRLQSDPTANPTISTLLPVARFFGITVEQLVSEKYLSAKRDHDFEQPVLQSVPILEWSQILMQKNDFAIRQGTTICIDIRAGKQAFALTVEADDWPAMPKKSVLIVDPDLLPESGDYVLLYRNGMQVPVVKQLLQDENQVYFKSLNPQLPLTIQEPEHTILGVIVQTRRRPW